MNRVPLVWMVDDNDGDVFLTKHYLAATDRYDAVEVLADAEEVLRRLRSAFESEAAAPGVLFVDVNMPGMSGFELVAELEASPHLVRDTALVLMTSLVVPADRTRAADSAVVREYRVKPLTAEQLTRIADTYGA